MKTVNRRRFQPACCFTAGKSDARRNLLQPVTEFTSVQRIQTKLTPISSKGCVLHFSNISRSPAIAVYRLTPELSGFSHIWDKLASISLNGKYCRLSNNSRLRKLSSPWPNISMNRRLGRIGSNKKAHHYFWWASLFSNFLSSQVASNQVLSAFVSLTSMFGMDIGVSSQLLSLYIK